MKPVLHKTTKRAGVPISWSAARGRVSVKACSFEGSGERSVLGLRHACCCGDGAAMDDILGARVGAFSGFTLIIVGGAAVASGRAIGDSWKPAWAAVAAAAGLA